MLQRLLRGLEMSALLIIIIFISGYSTPSPADPIEKIRAYTRNVEFNFIGWMSNAAVLKMRAQSIGAPYIFERATQKQIVDEYLRVTQAVLDKESALEQIYVDPTVDDKESASREIRAELTDLQTRQDNIAPLAESILQEQVSVILVEQGFTIAGQAIPNVWYHATPLPLALIISPRDRIEQTANVSLETDLTVDEQAALESKVNAGLNVSSLSVPIGGVGVYPTMILRNTNMNWLTTVIAHEWIHNYLTLRPLGMLYMETPELRTMNETTAAIAGDEIGALVIESFYAELKPATFFPATLISIPNNHPNPADVRPPFDFRTAMHTTRVKTDELLAAEKIDEAEKYMEARRAIFLKNGYVIRKINQAYFAFYGAYADSPGGAAGEDPVGPAVRALRAQSASLVEFVDTISKMTSFAQLQAAVK